MRKIQTFDSGQWNAFFRCSNDLCRAWFPYKVIETYFDESLIKGREGKTKWQKKLNLRSKHEIALSEG